MTTTEKSIKRYISPKWANRRPEEFTNWIKEDLYRHLDMQFLCAIKSLSRQTDPRCVDPGKTVVSRENLVALINQRLAALGHDLDEVEMDFRTLGMAVYYFCRLHHNAIVTISAPSRCKYLLTENGAAARIADYVIEHIGDVEKWRARVWDASTKGEIAAARRQVPQAAHTAPNSPQSN